MRFKFGWIQPWTTELAALDQFKISFTFKSTIQNILMTCCQVSDRCPLGYLFIISTAGLSFFLSFFLSFLSFFFLAHLSRRLKGELIVYRAIRRPLVCACDSASVNIFKLEYLRNQWANRNQILSEASLGWGIDCIRFWTR